MQYDDQRRVIQNVIASGGFAFDYAYLDSAFADGPNNWSQRTIRTAPDATELRVYTNHVTQVLLQEFRTPSPVEKWIDHQTLDSSHHLTMRVHPSGIDMDASPIYDPSVADLDVALRDDEGLFQLWEYGTPSGQPAGYLTYAKLRKGTDGTAETIHRNEYSSLAFGGFTIYKLDQETVYRIAPEDPDYDSGTDDIETAYSYTFYSGTAGVASRQVQLPTVPTTQNGTGQSIYRRELYNLYGNVTAVQDERGYVTTFLYDLPTGSLTKTVQDDDAPSGSGWTVPSGTRLKLTTDMTVDDEGRRTLAQGPQHEVDLGSGIGAKQVRSVTYNIYRDHCGTNYDEIWTAQGYYRIDDGKYYLVNPVAISRAGRDGLAADTIAAVRGSMVVSEGALSEANDSFPQTSWVRWSHDVIDTKGQKTEAWVYHNIPSSGMGTEGPAGNYNRTLFLHEPDTGSQIGVKPPGGTITRTTFDQRSRPTGTWVGTNDFNFGSVNFSTSGTSNLVQVNASEYDDGEDGGDDNVTMSVAYVDAVNGSERETTFEYDYRNRQEMVFVTDGTYTTYTKTTYDNLDQAVIVERFEHPTMGSDVLIGKSATEFDNAGRVYQTRRYSVAGTPPSPGSALVDETWHDNAGNVIEQVGASSQAFTKTDFDSVSRPVKRKIGYDTGFGDKVFVQVNTTYDAASNVIQTEALARYHDATTTGELTANVNARPQYTALYPDAIGRGQAVARYGTNGGLGFFRSSTVPGRSDIILVDSTSYNIRGEADTQTDPRGIASHEEFDDAGRRTERIENYIPSSSSSSSSSTPCFTEDENVTTRWTYNADSQPATVTAVNPSTGDQTTNYTYGVTIAGGSKLESNDLLAQVTFPDGSTAEFAYNRQGERIGLTDQNDTVHAFTIDKLGRTNEDHVTAFGAGKDQTVDRIGTSFDVRGRVEALTAYKKVGGAVHSQIVNEYNGLDMPTKQYQEHLGAKDANTLYVGFNYDEAASGGVYTKGLRLASLRYPSGRLVYHDYGTSGGDGDMLSRVAAIKDNDGTTVLAAYTYLGLDRVVVEDFQEPDVWLNYTDATSGGSSSSSSSSSSSGAADKYPGFDQFDRVIRQQWQYYGTPTADRDRFDYGYDRNGNVVWRQHGLCSQKDEFRTYDALNRLKTYERGTLNATKTDITSPVRSEDFSLDPSGNWKCYDIGGSGTTALNQRRTHNNVNEITAITEGSGEAQWVDPQYDTAGNMIRCPQPANLTAGFDLTYDAWNRLVEVEPSQDSSSSSSSGGGTSAVGQYQYGPANTRIVSYVPATGKYQHFYTLPDGRIIETRETTSAATHPESVGYQNQWMWGARASTCGSCDKGLPLRATAPMLRDQSSGSPSRIYFLVDATGNTTSLVTANGTALERYVYNAYGEVVVLDASCNPRSPNESLYGNSILTADSWLDWESYLVLLTTYYFHTALGTILADEESDEDKKKGKKDKCCCCAKSVVINDGGLKPDGAGGQFYAVDVDLNTVWKPSATYQDCELEWWERSNVPLGSRDPKTGKQRLGPNTWWNMYKEEHDSPTFKPWRDKDEVTDCDPSVEKKFTINDTPNTTIPAGGKVFINIWFAIVLRSAKDCPCDDPRDAEAYARLNIDVDLKRKRKIAKLHPGQWMKPPDYPKGLPMRPDKPAKPVK